MTTFYIVRHGETNQNVKRIIEGHGDSPLNENGELQAKNISEKLKHIQFDKAFSSDLLRAKRTAEVIALEHNLLVETTKMLRERFYGKVEGQPYTYFDAYDELIAKLTEIERDTYKFDDTYESNDELISRIFTFIRETAIGHPSKTILVATHGGVLMHILRHVGYLTYQDKVFVSNTGHIVLETDGSDFFVKEVHGLTKVEEKKEKEA